MSCVCVCACVLRCVLYDTRFVGQLYAAESLVLLDRIPEAMHYLSPDTITNISSSPVARKTTLTIIIVHCLSVQMVTVILHQ